MLRKTILCLAAWASASVMAAVNPKSIEPITDPSHCPGSPSHPLGGVIPHLSTQADAAKEPMTVTLYIKAEDEWGSPVRTMRLCAFSLDGKLIGGSTTLYPDNYRMWFNQAEGSEGISLAKLLNMTTDELQFREFQLYFNFDGPSIVEWGVAGNKTQLQAFSRAPIESRVGVFFPDGRGFVGGVDTVLYISRTTYEQTEACEVGVTVYDDGAQPLAQRKVRIPPRGVGRVDLGKLVPGSTGALDVGATYGSCGNLYVSRETSYRSDALGHKGLFIDVRQ